MVHGCRLGEPGAPGLVDGRGGGKLGERSFAHSGEGLAEMADWAVRLTGSPAAAIDVAIEAPHGPVVESLMERGFRLWSINPKQADRFRDRFSPAGAKDDSRDAQVLATLCAPISGPSAP